MTGCTFPVTPQTCLGLKPATSDCVVRVILCGQCIDEVAWTKTCLCFFSIEQTLSLSCSLGARSVSLSARILSRRQRRRRRTRSKRRRYRWHHRFFVGPLKQVELFVPVPWGSGSLSRRWFGSFWFSGDCVRAEARIRSFMKRQVVLSLTKKFIDM